MEYFTLDEYNYIFNKLLVPETVAEINNVEKKVTIRSRTDSEFAIERPQNHVAML